MPILQIIIILVVLAIVFVLVNKYVKDSLIKRIINIGLGVLATIWLLYVFGVWDSLRSVTV